MRQWLKKHLPKSESVNEKLKNYPRLAKMLSDPNLWTLNRRSARRGVAVGLFITCIPIPLQLLMAVLAAIFFRANLPTAVLVSMINNPFTFVPINYFIYRLGKWILLEDFHGNGFTHFSWHLDSLQSAWASLMIWLPQFGKSYFLGLLVTVICVTVFGYLLTDLCWRMDVHWRLRRRKKQREIKT